MDKPELDGAKARMGRDGRQGPGRHRRLGEAQLVLGDAILRSPIAGVVLKRSIERGSLVSQARRPFVLADTASVKVVFGVPDIVVSSLKIGRSPAPHLRSAQERAVRGRITSIAPARIPVSQRLPRSRSPCPTRSTGSKSGSSPRCSWPIKPGNTVVTVPSRSDHQAGERLGGVRRVRTRPPGRRRGGREASPGHARRSGRQCDHGDGRTRGGQRVLVRGATLVTDGQTRPRPAVNRRHESRATGRRVGGHQHNTARFFVEHRSRLGAPRRHVLWGAFAYYKMPKRKGPGLFPRAPRSRSASGPGISAERLEALVTAERSSPRSPRTRPSPSSSRSCAPA